MKCVLCKKNEALDDTLICEECSADLWGNTRERFHRMREALEYLDKWRSTREVAEMLGVKRKTAKDYLEYLLELGLVERRMALRVNGKHLGHWKMVWRRKIEDERYNRAK